MGKYIYGVIELPKPRRFDFSGLENAEVYTINRQELAAVVSDTGVNELFPTRQNVLAHTVVQDRLLMEFDLLPTGFGLIAKNEEEVRRLLANNYQGLHGELDRLAGKIEVELKVFWDQQAMITELQGEDREINKLKTRISAASPNETRSLLLEAGRQVERIALNWKTRYAERVYAIISRMAADSRLNNTMGVKNILNASFLIDKSREKEFQKEVYRLDSEYRGKVNFKYVGPLPPYSFINLKLEP